MRIDSVLLLRVSSPVDKDVEHPQFFDPPYPLKYLQAGLARYDNVSVQLLDCWIRPMSVSEMAARISEGGYDLVVISASSFDIDVANALATSLKAGESSALLVGIGQGQYLNSEGGRSGYDAILLGEPEEEFFRLFDRIRDSGGDGTGWAEHYRKCFLENRRFLVENPDGLPFPSYSPEELESYRSIFPVQVSRRVVWGYLIATRGCPNSCMFCSEVMRVSIGKKLRLRSAAGVADEMESLARQGANICSFQDDSFSANRRFVRSLCEELIARKSTMPWMARVRVDEVNFELLEMMKKAGCVMLGLGVESGSQRIIDEMKKQRGSKPWPDRCRQVFRWTAKLGIGTNAYYVIGNPGETMKEIEETIRLAMELNSDSIQVHFYTPYPGSAAWDTYREQFSEHDPKSLYHYAVPMFSLAKVPVEDLVRARSRFYRRYILRPRFALTHAWRHAAFYWHNPDILRNLLGIRKVM